MPRIKAYASAKIYRRHRIYEKTPRSKDSISAFLSLAALRIEAQLNVYLLNNYQTDIQQLSDI